MVVKSPCILDAFNLDIDEYDTFIFGGFRQMKIQQNFATSWGSKKQLSAQNSCQVGEAIT